MNILLTTHVVPWPVTSGASIRIASVIEALSRLGTVDVVCLVEPSRVEGRAVPPDAPVDRVTILPRPPRLDRGDRARGRVRWLLAGGRPLKLARDYTPVRDSFSAWARDDYDLAWLGGPEGFTAFADLIDAPLVCNFDDLEDQKLLRRLALGIDDRAAPRRSPAASAWAATRDRLDVMRWRRLHALIGSRCAALAVCSEQDSRALSSAGVTNVEVVPNVYAEPPCPVGGAEARNPPTISFVGVLTYEPNIDAARFLVRDVLPHLRRRLGSFELRLVGSHDQRVADLGSVSGVTVTGAVGDITTELARADVAAVPIRFGGGTRVKILEAFAHRIPVVSTTLGAEGLEVVDGEHLLLADDAASFAAACEQALDASVRTRLRASAHELWHASYRPDTLTARVAELARKAVN